MSRVDSRATNELRRLLEEFDRANRLEIDALYAQLSPTLDDFYAETLTIEFRRTSARGISLVGSAGAGWGWADGDVAAIRPELALTRTVPGLASRSVRALGAWFPLERARALTVEALTQVVGMAAHACSAPVGVPSGGVAGTVPAAAALLARLVSGAAWLAPAQVGISQSVALRFMPDNRDALDVLDGSGGPAR